MQPGPDKPSYESGALLASCAALIALGGIATGILAMYVLSGDYTNYRRFPTYFYPPQDFRLGCAGVIVAAAGFAVLFAGIWVLCGRLGTGGSLRKRLALDARVFPSLAISCFAWGMMMEGTAPGLAPLFILMVAVAPPLALLACRLSAKVTWLLPAGTARRPLAVLMVMTAAFCTFFAVQTVRQYHALNLGYADSGYVAEALSNTLRGRFFWCNSLPFGNYFGDHFSPILLFLLPVYAFFPVHETILIVHAIAIGSGAIPVYLLARRMVRPARGAEFAGLALAAAYLLHPAVQFQNFCFSYAFKAASLGIPLLLWAAYFAVGRRAGLFVLFGLLSLACEESLAPVVLSLGVYAALSRSAKAGWVVAGMAVAWWFAATQLIMPAVRGGGPSTQFTAFYSWMGESPAGIVRFVLTNPKAILKRFWDREVFIFLVQMTLPLAMLCLLSPGAMAMGAITFVFLVLIRQPAFLSIYFQYKAGLIPVVFFATAVALGKLAGSSVAKGILGPSPANGRSARFAGCLILVAAAANCYLFGPTPLSHNYVASFYRTDRYDAVREIQKLVPHDAALLASERIAAHFTRQALLHRLSGDPTVDYDFVLLDLDDIWGGREEAFALRRKYLSDKRYAPVYARDGFLLFAKGARKPDSLRPFGPQDARIIDEIKNPVHIPAWQEAEIIYLQFGGAPPGTPRANTALLVYWKCLKPIETDRACTITIVNESDEGTQTFKRRFHPCRGLFPTSMWRPGMIIADRYDMELPFDATKGKTRVAGFGWHDLLPQKRDPKDEGGQGK